LHLHQFGRAHHLKETWRKLNRCASATLLVAGYLPQSCEVCMDGVGCEKEMDVMKEERGWKQFHGFQTQKQHIKVAATLLIE
tara:strand:- start:320 stop:565 length:246 start_codon:yes stop_codon:yes gene_type:complete